MRNQGSNTAGEAKSFLETYNRIYQSLYTVANQLNKRWWECVARYQGVAPPEPRGEDFCDAATKTHINDNPAEYYRYAIAFAIKYQLHMHIAKKILHQDPHNTSFKGNKQVGKFL